MTVIISIFLLSGSFAQKTANKELELTQDKTTTSVKTNGGIVLVPGLWEHLNFEKSSGQQYLKNEKDVIIAIAKNPKKIYPFYKPTQSNYKTIKAFTKWEIDYQKEMKRKTRVLKKDSASTFQIWKFTDENNIDNVFLYGGIDDHILNLLVYTNAWEEKEKMRFLEKTFTINSK